jgi:hypothetical protein
MIGVISPFGQSWRYDPDVALGTLALAAGTVAASAVIAMAAAKAALRLARDSTVRVAIGFWSMWGPLMVLLLSIAWASHNCAVANASRP